MIETQLAHRPGLLALEVKVHPKVPPEVQKVVWEFVWVLLLRLILIYSAFETKNTSSMAELSHTSG